jgi:hypothetical protein
MFFFIVLCFFCQNPENRENPKNTENLQKSEKYEKIRKIPKIRKPPKIQRFFWEFKIRTPPFESEQISTSLVND